MLRKELDAVLSKLLAASSTTGVISLDAVGEAVGTLSVSTGEIDALLGALEAQGRHIASPEGGAGEGHLKRVVAAVRVLKRDEAHRPTLRDVAVQAGLSRSDVLQALALLHIMQR